MILLTDEEIKVFSWNRERNPEGYMDNCKRIAKAQLKKVVEEIKRGNELNDEPWGEDVSAYGYDPIEKGSLLLGPEKWQALLKEIE